MTVKSNSLSQGTRRPGVRTVRMVGHMAGDKTPWSWTEKFPGFSPELLPLNRWPHDPSEWGEGCGSGLAAPQTLQGLGHGEGPQSDFVLFQGHITRMVVTHPPLGCDCFPPPFSYWLWFWVFLSWWPSFVRAGESACGAAHTPYKGSWDIPYLRSTQLMELTHTQVLREPKGQVWDPASFLSACWKVLSSSLLLLLQDLNSQGNCFLFPKPTL